MKIVNLNTGENVHQLLFPDKQPHVNIPGLEKGEEVKLIVSLTSTDLLLQMLECANAIDHAGAIKKQLVIPYLMGARYDRLMNIGDSVDLEVIAALINSMGFEQVQLLDVHSDVSLKLIKNSVNVTNKTLVAHYKLKNAVLICPDKGAQRKVAEQMHWNSGFSDIVFCNKSRDLQNGRITLKVEEPEKCRGRNCVIIDDICDGGGTFLAIAAQVEAGQLTLIVTHGIFSKGFQQLEECFDQVIVSNSYATGYDSEIVEVVNLDYDSF